jgi:membrane fusion protein (multidrug efflux system)
MGVAVMLCHTSCDSKKEEKKEEIKLLVTSPLKKDTTAIHEFVSQIRAIQHIELRALEKGYLKKIYVDEGQFVKKGQLMFQILPLQYQAEFQKHKLKQILLKSNTKTLNRWQKVILFLKTN